jgi:hypothetical protein
MIAQGTALKNMMPRQLDKKGKGLYQIVKSRPSNDPFKEISLSDVYLNIKDFSTFNVWDYLINSEKAKIGKSF